MADKRQSGCPKITVIGSNMIDLVTNVNRMPKRGETVEAPSFDFGFGGARSRGAYGYEGR